MCRLQTTVDKGFRQQKVFKTFTVEKSVTATKLIKSASTKFCWSQRTATMELKFFKLYFNFKQKTEMRTVKNILETKDDQANSIEPDLMVIDALKKLISVNLSYLVVFENSEYMGIFSERDYTRKLVLEGRSSRETKVRDVLASDLPEVNLDDTVEECMYKMNTRGTRYLAAFNEEKFAGIVTLHDVLREVLASKENVFDNSLTNSLLDYDESGKVF